MRGSIPGDPHTRRQYNEALRDNLRIGIQRATDRIDALHQDLNAITSNSPQAKQQKDEIYSEIQELKATRQGYYDELHKL